MTFGLPRPARASGRAPCVAKANDNIGRSRAQPRLQKRPCKKKKKKKKKRRECDAGSRRARPPAHPAGRRRDHLPRQRARVRRGEIRPRVREMDEHAKIRDLIEALRARRHGDRDPGELRRHRAARFFHAVLAVEELSRVDPSVGVLVDVQNTLFNNALMRWGSDDASGGTCRGWRRRPSAPTRSRRRGPAATPSR